MDFDKAARDPWVWGQLLVLAVIAVIPVLLPRFINLGRADFLLNRIDPDSIRWLGGGLLMLGIGVAAWGVRSLGPGLTPGTEPLPGAPLVTEGAYAYVRHPIYLGVVLAATGYAVAWSNWALGALLGLVALKFFEAKAGAEERWLMERYPEYARYMVHVRRRLL